MKCFDGWLLVSYSYSSRNGVSLGFKMVVKGKDDKGNN